MPSHLNSTGGALYYNTDFQLKFQDVNELFKDSNKPPLVVQQRLRIYICFLSARIFKKNSYLTQHILLVSPAVAEVK